MPTRDELFAYVKATFGTEPDYPWPQEPEYAVLRHADNGKWYGIVMSVPPYPSWGCLGEETSKSSM